MVDKTWEKNENYSHTYMTQHCHYLAAKSIFPQHLERENTQLKSPYILLTFPFFVLTFVSSIHDTGVQMLVLLQHIWSWLFLEGSVGAPYHSPLA